MKFPGLFSRSADAAAVDDQRQLGELQARHDAASQELASIEQQIGDLALAAETGDGEAADELARRQRQRSELALRRETLGLAMAELHRRLEAAEVRAAAEERARQAEQLRQTLAARLEWAEEAEKLLRQLTTALTEMAERGAEADRLYRALSARRDRGVTIALERPFAHDDVVQRISQFAAGIGALQWLDSRYLSQQTPVMNYPEHERSGRTPPFTGGEADVHSRILAVAAPEEQQAEPQAA